MEGRDPTNCAEEAALASPKLKLKFKLVSMYYYLFMVLAFLRKSLKFKKSTVVPEKSLILFKNSLKISKHLEFLFQIN